MPVEREERHVRIFSEFREPIRGVPFEVFIQSVFNQRVERFDTTLRGSIELLNLMKNAMREVCDEVRDDPIDRPRPNEVGNDMEHPVIRQLRSAGLDAEGPKTRDGGRQTVGYPDIEIVTGLVAPAVYLEVKTFNARNKNTTQRSFYLSPPPNDEKAKVTKDAHHLMVAFEMVRSGTLYHPVAFELVDLYGLPCDIKMEIQSDNLRLYHPERVLHYEGVG